MTNTTDRPPMPERDTFFIDPLGHYYSCWKTADNTKNGTTTIEQWSQQGWDKYDSVWQPLVDEAVLIHLTDQHWTDAKTMLNQIICWHTSVALDPVVSEDARKLRDTYKEERDTLAKSLEESQRNCEAACKRVEDLESQSLVLRELWSRVDMFLCRICVSTLGKMSERETQIFTACIDASQEIRKALADSHSGCACHGETMTDAGEDVAQGKGGV